MELQQFFIRIRDELCKNGEILLSSALNYSLKHLHSDVEQEKREKIPKEIEEDRQKKDEEEGDSKGMWLYVRVWLCCLNLAHSAFITKRRWES